MRSSLLGPGGGRYQISMPSRGCYDVVGSGTKSERISCRALFYNGRHVTPRGCSWSVKQDHQFLTKISTIEKNINLLIPLINGLNSTPTVLSGHLWWLIKHHVWLFVKQKKKKKKKRTKQNKNKTITQPSNFHSIAKHFIDILKSQAMYIWCILSNVS